MTTVRFTLDPANPPRLSPEEQARLDRMADDEITAAALADQDAQPLTEEEIARAEAARVAKAARAATGTTQPEFAARYNISLGRLRDIEQGRGKRPDTVVLSYLRVIAHAPSVVDESLARAEQRVI